MPKKTATKKKATKKPVAKKKPCSGKCKKDSPLNVDFPARASYSFGIKMQVANYEPIDVAHSFSASAEPGETDIALNIRVAKEAMRQFKEVYTDALMALKTLKDEAFEDLLDEE